MATDTLEIFGTEYSGVTGIKATDSNNQTKTYIRPQGTKSISANGSGIDVVNYASVDVNVSGGSTGLEYETGTYTPSADIAKPTISFANTHTEAPVLVLLADMTGTVDTTTYTNYYFMYADYYKLWGAGVPYSSSAFRYAVASYSFRTNSSTSDTTTGSTVMQHNSDNTGSGTSGYPRYWVTETEFYPYTGSTSRYWRAGRTYKWIAVWKPTT